MRSTNERLRIERDKLRQAVAGIHTRDDVEHALMVSEATTEAVRYILEADRPSKHGQILGSALALIAAAGRRDSPVELPQMRGVQDHFLTAVAAGLHKDGDPLPQSSPT
jgi:hypothetical protein